MSNTKAPSKSQPSQTKTTLSKNDKATPAHLTLLLVCVVCTKGRKPILNHHQKLVKYRINFF